MSTIDHATSINHLEAATNLATTSRNDAARTHAIIGVCIALVLFFNTATRLLVKVEEKLDSEDV